MHIKIFEKGLIFFQESKEITNEGQKASEKKGDDLMDVEDTDDYLFYLEDILKTIHKVGAAVRACSRSCVNPADDDT